MQQGRAARQRTEELLDAMHRGAVVMWSADRRHIFEDGTCLALEVEHEPRNPRDNVGHVRAVLRDRNGDEIDATEWVTDPDIKERMIPGLRLAVDEQLARRIT